MLKPRASSEDLAKLQGFLKSAKINANERVASFFQCEDARSCLNAFDKIAFPRSTSGLSIQAS
jgi:hypothetical protein